MNVVQQPSATPWQMVPLGEIAEIKLGKMLDRSKHTTGSKLPYLRNVNVRWGAIETDDLLEMYFDDDQLERFGIKDNDVLVCEGGEPGRAAVWQGGPTYLKFQKALHRVRFRVPYEPRLLVYLLELLAKSGSLERRFTGSTIKHFTREAFLELPVPRLPLTEQQRVVAEIEKQFTRLDAAVAALQRMRANLRAYRTAILKTAFEGCLGTPYVPRSTTEATTEFISDILAHRKQLDAGSENEAFQVADGEVLPQIPAGWAWCRLGQLSWSSGYGTSVKCSYDNAGPPILRIPNIANGRIDCEDLKFAATKEVLTGDWSVTPGDLLVIRTNGSRTLIGRGAVVRKFTEPLTGFASYLIRFRLAGPPILSQWVSAIWDAPFIRAWLEQRAATSAGQYNLSMTTLSQLPLPLPSPTEQVHLIAEIEHRLSVVAELERVVKANLQRAVRLRQSILERAFSGRLIKSNVTTKSVAKAKGMSPASRRHFLRALLSAEIVHQLHAEPTFGQTKHQKIFHLCEHIAGITDLDVQYHRDAAGPYDNRLIYGNEAELKRQKWYESYSRKKFGHGYRPLAKAGGHEKYLDRYWPEKLETIRRLIRIMRCWDTERCEIFSTAYAAWNDLLLWGQEASDDAIVHEVLHRWHENKQRIPEARWRKALGWMRKEGFVPTGFGKPTAAARL